jgi:membrane-bound serine protease (ClpP class)
MMRRLGWIVGVALGLVIVLGSPAVAAGRILVASLDGPVDPFTARYVQRVVAAAERENAAGILLRIDTPGGLDSSMRKIIKVVLDSDVPVVCYVGPSGARAASAGAFILIGCPIAAMAPGTNVGAAHPVGFRGEVVSEKVTNDAAAYIRALAQRWGRNAAWAERAVRDSVSASAGEALRLGVIDLVAADEGSLLKAIDGRSVITGEGRSVLRTEGARLIDEDMSFIESLLHKAVDPNLAFLLFVLGLGGIIFEITHPGLNVPGVLGGLALVTSLVILGLLPVNLAGLLLILAALGFFVLDLQVAGHGLPTVAGITALVLGGLFLFDASVPTARVSKGLIVGVAAAVAFFFGVVVRAVVRARRQPAGAGLEGLVGSEAVVVGPGVVRAAGEEWSARSQAGELPSGTRVRVLGVEGLTLRVEPIVETEVAT